MRFRNQDEAFCFEAVHSARLDTFRRLFALTFLTYTGWRFLHGYEWLTAYGFHYTVETAPTYHARPFPLLPAWLLPAFGILMIGSTASLVAGWKPRIMVWPVLGCAIYIQQADLVSAFTLNKLYIVGFGVLAAAPKPQIYAFADGSTRLMQSVWPIRILQATILIEYFTAGICKSVQGDWLRHSDVLWTQVQGIYRTETAAFMLRHVPNWGWTAMMYSALTFELLAPFLFCVKRLRPVGYLWGIGFHLMIALTMHTVFFFSFQSVSFYVLIMDTRNLLALRRWLGLRESGP